jgi:hypothetical protein
VAARRCCFVVAAPDAWLRCLQVLGVDHEDPMLADAIRLLMESQLGDGSWPIEGEASHYNRYMVASCALMGLVKMHFRGKLPLRISLMRFLMMLSSA